MDNELEPDSDCVDYLTNHHYIKNHPPETLLKEFNYKIPLDRFICYCVGIIGEERKVQCIRILQKRPSDKLTTMNIEWYDPQGKRDEVTKQHHKIQFWINSGICLKRHFFLFEDKLNFFRSTFIHFPEIEQYYRLSSIFNFIDIPQVNPVHMKIYVTPLKKYCYKKPVSYSSEKSENRKRKEIEKAVTRVFKKISIDPYFEQHYPVLFKEMNKLNQG